MSQYRYSPLTSGHDSIRLLRLMPHEDEADDIHCELFEYSLQNSCKGIHLYEALSYVWGNPEKKLPLFMHNHSFDVTVNLHAALSRLRNHSMERILWIDALCIDQANQKEKEHQIQSMAKIYGKANRVVVWLGEAADDSDLAFEDIRVAGGKKSTNSLDSERIQPAVLALLQRPWFQRIWILQEVAAARNVLIICGSKKIDGYVFCLGVDLLNHFYKACLDLQGSIRSVTYLIREAIFRPDYLVGSLGRSSLDICPLGELMDMYHAHRATKRHDKVYALLGMSSDDLSKVGLLPNYEVPWEKLLQRLTKYLLSEKISVETWGDKEIAVIKSKGCILGTVLLVERNVVRDDRQGVDVIFKNIISKNIPGQPGCMGERSARWTLQASAKPIQDGDLICLLQGALKPTIIRLGKDHFVIIMIAATPSENIQTERFFNRDFLLVWDWENSLEKLQDLEHEALIRTKDWGLEHSELESGGNLGKATRTWNVALILGDLEEYREAEERHREAVKGYEIAFGEEGLYTLRSQYGQTPLLWAAENGYDTVVGLLLTNKDTDPDLKDSQYGQTPLSWAAKGGHEAVVKLLLKTGKVDVDSKDSQYGQTPMLRAAQGGHEAVVKLLLKIGKVNVDLKESTGETPLTWAALRGHEAVVKLLLKTGKVDFDLKDSQYGRTPLAWAALHGHEAVVKLLLEAGKVEVNSKESQYGRTPLAWAALHGHEAVVSLLLGTDEVDTDSKDDWEQTPLSLAAEGGHIAVVILLLKTGKVDVDSKESQYGQTPLSLAAKGGHEDVFKLLLDTGKVDVDSKDTWKKTPLRFAAEGGHEVVVKLLLETGKVDVDSYDNQNKQTPLSIAAKKGHEAVVKLLLETGKVDVDLNDSQYRLTLLSLAAKGGHEDVVKLLLETGKVDVNSNDNQYRRAPLSLAAKGGHEALVKLLLETGKVDVDLNDSQYRLTLLSLAAKGGHEDVVKLLLETGKVDVNSNDNQYRRAPLSLAAKGGHEALVKLLLETGKVDADSKDSEYMHTPLMLAAVGGHEAVVKLLLETGKVYVN